MTLSPNPPPAYGEGDGWERKYAKLLILIYNMAVKIKAIVRKVCPTVEGEYLGTNYKYADLLVEQVREENEQWNPCKMAVRLKGAKLDEFLESKVATDEVAHEFTLYFEAAQSRDDKERIYNKVPTVVEFK